MEVNKNIFPDVVATDYYTLSRPLTTDYYPREVLDKSCAYSASPSNRAPYNRIMASWAYASNGGELPVSSFNDMWQSVQEWYKNYQEIVLLAGDSAGLTYNQLVNQYRGVRGLYTFGNYLTPDSTQDLSGFRIVTAMQFNAMIGMLYLKLQIYDAPPLGGTTVNLVNSRVWVTPAEYTANYASNPNAYIIGAYIIDIVAGNPTTRTGAKQIIPIHRDVLKTRICFYNYNSTAFGYDSGEVDLLAYGNIGWEGQNANPFGQWQKSNIAPVFCGSCASNYTGDVSPLTSNNNEVVLNTWPATPLQTGAGGQYVIGCDKGAGVNINAQMATSSSTTNYIVIGTKDLNSIYTRAATMGIICALSGTAYDADLTDPINVGGLLIPILEDDGTYKGNYILTDDPDAPTQYAASNIPGLIDGGKDATYINGAPEGGAEDVDPNTYTDTIDMVTPALTATGIFNRAFVLNSNQVGQLADKLWGADDTFFNRLVDGLALMGGNPIAGIIDLRLYPFDLRALGAASGATSNIIIGRTDTEITAYTLDNSPVARVTLGSCKFMKYFKNFLDYEPYTTAEFYIPFVGKIPIPVVNFLGKELSVDMVVDYNTGACCAVIFADGLPVIYHNGVVGVSIQVTGDNAAAEASSTLNRIIGAVGDVVGAAGSALTGDIGGAVRGATGAITNAFGAASTPIQYQTSGTATPQTALYLPKNPYLIIYSPEVIAPPDYGHTVGYACEIDTALSAVSGFAVFSNFDTSGITATDEEKRMIKNYLESGVYL